MKENGNIALIQKTALGLLVVILSCFGPNVYASTNEPDYTDKIYEAFNKFKIGNDAEAIKIMEGSGFKLERLFSQEINPEGQVDSLIFKIEQESFVTFSRVNLGYLANVSAAIIIISGHSKKLLTKYIKLLRKKGLILNTANCDQTICADFRNDGEFWVVDKRWPEWTYTRFKWLYSHHLSIIGDYLKVNLFEIVPEQWITTEEVPEKYR